MTSTEFTVGRLLACALIAPTIGLIGTALQGPDGRLVLDLRHPASVYSLFYFLYYVLPYISLLVNGQLAPGEEPFLALLILVGCACWQAGMRRAATPSRASRVAVSSEKAAAALVVVLGLSILGVAWGFAWRVREGIFYNQARFYQQEATIADSLSNVFAAQLQSPIILLLGLLASSRLGSFGQISRAVLVLYGAAIVATLTLASQTRPAITGTIFVTLALGLRSPIEWNSRKLIGLATVSIVVVLAVQGLRLTQSEEFAAAPNQLTYAVENVARGLGSMLSDTEERSAMSGAVRSRAAGGVEFLAVIVREIDTRGEPFYGEGTAQGLVGLVPRALWPDKPTITSPQIVMQELLGFPVYSDASAGPLIQFYFEGGVLGVAIGYLIFGWLVGWMTKRTFAADRIVWWIVLAFVWGAIANLEQELVLGMFGALRVAALVSAAWYAVFFFLGGAGEVRCATR